MKTIVLTFIASLLVLSQPTWAANRYVRAGAAGNGSGADWANAYPSLPASLVRGDTYYIASGNYPAYTFDDPQSGSQLITIKKATSGDRGTDVGWSDAYGAGQAVFSSTLRFSSGYYMLDGSVRNEGDWFDGNAYGFRIDHSNRDQNIVIAGGSASSNITIKHVYVDAIYGNLPGNTVRRYAIDTDTYGGSVATGLIFHRMYVRGSNNVWFLRNTNGAVVEYSASDGAQSNAANHGEIVNLYYSGNNAVVRYNRWKNAFVGDGGTALVAITQADGLQFYGNIVSNFNVGDGAIGFNGYSSSRNRVYNNTFIGGVGWNSGVAWGSGSDNQTYNNLFINCRTVNLAGAHDYNGFSDANGRGEPNAQINIGAAVFSNLAAGDFRLATQTNAGLSLPSPFNVDMLGVRRDGDGIVSRGALEFGGGGAGSVTQLLPPSNLRIQ